jgi:hypothetical protein
MIESINDIYKYTENDEYTMIYSKNNLAELFHQSKSTGYEPYLKFTAGVVSELLFKFKVKLGKRKYKEIKYKVKTKNLIPSSVDGSSTVETEQVYNRMSKAMYEFNKKLFNPLHKSFYNELDVKILNSCRSVAPCGWLCRRYFTEDEKGHRIVNAFSNPVEIDINKAYTYHLTQITKVPKFTEFDEWKLYKYEKDDFNNLNPLTLYYVQWLGSANIFLTNPTV